MDHCKDRLRLLTRHCADLSQAVTNLIADLHDPRDNPYGNICPALAVAFADACRARGLDQLEQPGAALLEPIVKDHHSVRMPMLGRTAPHPPRALRRVLSATSFASYHRNRGGADAAGTTHAILDALKRQSGPAVEPITHLNGSTGPVPTTWWTFDLAADTASRLDPQRYMEELALPEHEIDRALADGLAIELILPSDAIAGPFFKPTAVDGFCTETRFRPELTGAEYGRTVPVGGGKTPRPETVAQSQDYERVGSEDTEITVNPLPVRWLKAVT